MSSPKVKTPKSESKDLAVVKSEDVVPEVEDVPAIPNAVMKKVNALKNLQVAYTEIEARFFEEMHVLECKYATLYEPLFAKRKTIVVGDYEPTAEEGVWKYDEEEDINEDDLKEMSPKAIEGVDESKLTPSALKLLSELKKKFTPENFVPAKMGENEKGIKDFWLTTLQSFRITKEIIVDYDEPILSFLEDISVKLVDKKPYGYTLEFHFGENPYFTDRVLTKTYELKTEVDKEDPFSFEGPSLGKATGCKIHWKEGKDVTVKIVKKKLKSKNKKAPPKIISKTEKQDSFFNFFTVPDFKKGKKDAKSPVSSGAEDSHHKKHRKSVSSVSHDEDEEDDEENEEEMYMLADFEIGQYIKDKILPKAVLYFSGEYEDEEFEEYDDEEGDEDDEDEDGDDDDDEPEDDDDDDEDDGHDHKKGGKCAHKHHGKPHGKTNGKVEGKAGEPTPNECKQQ